MKFKGVEIPECGILTVPATTPVTVVQALLDALLAEAERTGRRAPLVVALDEGQTIDSLTTDELRALLDDLESPAGVKPVSVAAADHLMKVEAERDAYRGAIEAIPRHEQHVCNVKACSGICTRCWHPWPCATERAHRLIEDAG